MHPRKRRGTRRVLHPHHISSLLPILIHAQSIWKPSPAYHVNSVFIEEKAFYITGGYNNTDSSIANQTFLIDLSKSFNTSDPPYTKLKDAPSLGRVPNTLLQNGQDWFFSGIDIRATVYNLPSQTFSTWANQGSTKKIDFASGATTPVTGKFMIPTASDTDILQFGTEAYVGGYSFSGKTQPNEISTSRLYSIAPSQSDQAVFVLAGYFDSTNTSSSALFRFNSSNSTWTLVVTGGDAPTPRQGACMVPAYNGKELVVFGGFPVASLNNVTDMPGDGFSDIYVLDVANKKWTKGKSGGTDRARGGHVCAVTRDTLLIWGGKPNASQSPPDLLLAYDLSSNTWRDTFPDKGVGFAPGSESGASSVSGPGSAPSGSKAGAIAGGFGAVVLSVVIMFLVYRRRKAKATTKDSTSPAMNFGRPQIKPLWLLPSPHTPSNQTQAPKDDFKFDLQSFPTYTDLNPRSPEAVHRQPQQDEMQAKEHILNEYLRQRQIQLERQQELDRQIEKELAEVQMLRDRQNGTPTSPIERDKRAPQYWSAGSQPDLHKGNSFFGPSTDYHGSEPRNPQLYPSDSIHSDS
ncbi:hypothetical protein MVEG_10358 [Podila verticillata NRRL 6337]|nr:hypothetical protein MVEG_10358 [Podila verticillata NRRL 6337]